MKIGVTMPIAENDETQTTASYREIRDRALQAEAIGCDSIWIYDHLLFRAPNKPTAGIWEAWTILTALAEATQRVDLGTLVMCTAFRNPAILAKMAATLDEVCDGRLILGLGAGWHRPEFDAFGIPFDHRVDKFEEALAIIIPLLREGNVDFEGKHYSAPKGELRPRGPRSGGPPILIGAFGPRMLRLTAQYADSWNTCWLGDSSRLAGPRAELEAACAEVGRDPTSIKVTVGISVTYLAPGELPSNPIDPSKTLNGSAAQVAASLRAYADLDVDHVICALNTVTEESLAWFGDVLNKYHDMSPATA